MKKIIINSFLATTLLQTSIPYKVYAGEAMDQADKVITAHKELAKEKALSSLNEDFNFALTEMLKNVLNKSDLSEIKKNLFSEQEAILKGLNDLVEQKASDTADLKSQTYEAMEKYKAMVQKRFDISFKPAETKRQLRDSLVVANEVLARFERNCSKGKGIGGLDNPNFSYPALPRADFSISVGYGNEKGPQFNSSGSFSGTPGEKSRNEVANVSLTATSIVTSIAYSGSTGAAVIACQAAAPFMLAGGAAIAIGVMYMNQMERLKIQNEIVEAELHAFHQSADDRDIAKYYKESCKSLSLESQKLRRLLEKAISNPDDLLKNVSTSESWDSDLAQLMELLKKKEEQYNKVLVLLENRKQKDSPELQEEINKNLVELKNIDAEVKKVLTPEKVSEFMISYLVKQDQDFKNNLELSLWKSIDLQQRKAFEKVLILIQKLQKKNFQKYLNGEDDFGIEGQALDLFLNAKRNFKEVLAMQIKLIFGRVSSTEVKKSEEALRVQTKKLLKQYITNHEIAEFGRSVKSLIGDL